MKVEVPFSEPTKVVQPVRGAVKVTVPLFSDSVVGTFSVPLTAKQVVSGTTITLCEKVNIQCEERKRSCEVVAYVVAVALTEEISGTVTLYRESLSIGNSGVNSEISRLWLTS